MFSAIVLWLKVNAKAVVGFIVGLLINAIQDVINGNAPWPTSLQEWGKYLGTAVITGVAVWATGNKLTQKQVVKGAEQQGISVITDTAIDVTRNAAEKAVKDAVSAYSLPAGSNEIIGKVVHDVSKTVGDVMKGVASNFDVKLSDVL